MTDTDKRTFAPFQLVTGKYDFLSLSDSSMLGRSDIFQEKDGWEGNGYDWTSVAQVVVAERLPALAAALSFDPEAGMFSASGPIDALRQLGAEMKRVFDDESQLRVLLTRAVLD